MVSLDANSLLESTLADLLPALRARARAGGCPLCARCDERCEALARTLLFPRAEFWAARLATGDPAAVLAGVIDHTLLKPEATPAQVRALCREACEQRFAAICVNPRYVPLGVEMLQGSGIAVCTVAGFPLGAHAAAIKVEEARQAVQEGAGEVDMVLSIGDLKAGDYPAVQAEIAGVVQVCHAGGALCKVIVETALLSDTEKVRACRLVVAAGADFVKTSTGFAQGGATVFDVLLLRQTVGERVGVKAAGGIRTLPDALKMLVAGANRIGASAGVGIVEAVRTGR